MRATLSRARRWAGTVARAHWITGWIIGAYDQESGETAYAHCYRFGNKKYLIVLRLHNRRTGRPLCEETLLDSVCHELAHVRHFSHGRRWRALYLSMLRYARDVGLARDSK